ncbi:hypothetical protein VC83_02476 [Pseudogymnoascus destructans]|uniref:CCHC-type domain-containing protein n=1 Tax=Pseudogymnoascus destructans TaxID=655981 RepID=A0A177AIW4_9PEZI|nr:uncharacterized protein VC83_02476 [Pseudogymnoascus destructans]OAF61213.1 hypothetical protein VC83_02476 [Pseudogymnoascus destructans]
MGANLNSMSEDGDGALHHAAFSSQPAVVELFLELGISPNIIGKYGETPLHKATRYFLPWQVNNEGMVRILLDKGANTEAKNMDGETPLHRAAKRGYEIQTNLLLDGGANIEARGDNHDQTPLCLAASYGSESTTPLHLAAMNGHDMVVTMLLNNSANINGSDRSGYTPLSWAAWGGHEKVLNLLLDRGANPELLSTEPQQLPLVEAEGGHDGASLKHGSVFISTGCTLAYAGVRWCVFESGGVRQRVSDRVRRRTRRAPEYGVVCQHAPEYGVVHRRVYRAVTKTIGWIINAKRILTVAELEQVLAVEIETSEFDETNITDIEQLTSYCCGLVIVDEQTSNVALVHYTTQKYFEGTWKTWFPNIHELITDSCLTYISYNVFEDQFETEAKIEDIPREYPFYNYSSYNWGHHFRDGPEIGSNALKFLQSQAKISAYDRCGFEPFTGIEECGIKTSDIKAEPIAAFFNLENLMQELYSVQNKDNFATFWAEFQRLTVELDYSEETLIDDLCHKVNTKMQTALIAEINPSSLHAFAQKCLLIDQNIQQLQIQDARTVPQVIQQAFKPQDFHSKAKQPTTNPPAGFRPPRLYRAPHQNPATENLMQEGRCFHCQQTGHRAYECPTKNAQVHEVSTYDAPLSGKE